MVHEALRQRLSPPSNLTGMLISRLTEEIVAGKLPPRTRLPTEHALMQAFGVSRTVVREAIAALRAEGLVETRQGSGAFVATDPRKRPFRIDPELLSSVREIVDVLELRIGVEVEAAGLAAERRSRADLARLAKVNGAFAEAVARGNQAVDLDFDFHATIGAATGNPYFSSFLDFLGRLIIPRRSIHLDTGDAAARARYLARLVREHEAVRQAIVSADANAARRAMRVHLRHARDRYQRLADSGR